MKRIPPSIGITGGPGCGKSTAAQCLARAGCDVVDTDALARQAVEPGRPAAAAIRREFGPRFFDADGHLRRDSLARLVFSDESARLRLNAIIHPEVRALWKSAAARSADADRPCAIIIPLLFESGLDNEFTAIACVGCSPSTQRLRLRARGWDDDMIQKRIAAQWPLEEKCRRATHVIWNDGSLETLQNQVDLLARAIETLQEKPGLQNPET